MTLTRRYPELKTKREVDFTILELYELQSKMRKIVKTLEFNGMQVDLKDGIDSFSVLNRPTV